MAVRKREQVRKRLVGLMTGAQDEAELPLAAEQQQQQFDGQKMLLEMEQRQREFQANYLTKLTELELKYGQNVPGSMV